MALQNPPEAVAQMRIRRPVEDVFRSLVDPAVTTRFWFTGSSGALDPGATVRWEWHMYGVSTSVRVVALEPDRRILVHWGEPPRPLEFTLAPRPDGTTLVVVRDAGFAGSEDEKVAQAIDSMGGFSSMLAGMKAWLEHGIDLQLVADHQPDAQVTRS